MSIYSLQFNGRRTVSFVKLYFLRVQSTSHSIGRKTWLSNHPDFTVNSNTCFSALGFRSMYFVYRRFHQLSLHKAWISRSSSKENFVQVADKPTNLQVSRYVNSLTGVWIWTTYPVPYLASLSVATTDTITKSNLGKRGVVWLTLPGGGKELSQEQRQGGNTVQPFLNTPAPASFKTVQFLQTSTVEAILHASLACLQGCTTA